MQDRPTIRRYIPFTLDAELAIALDECQTGQDDDIVLAAEKGMRKVLAAHTGELHPDLQDIELEAIVTALPTSECTFFGWVDRSGDVHEAQRGDSIHNLPSDARPLWETAR